MKISSESTSLVLLFVVVEQGYQAAVVPEQMNVRGTRKELDVCLTFFPFSQAQVRAHQALSVNVKTTSGYTPLHMAVLHGHDDMVRLFLEHGAHVSTQNHKNLTPLHISACLRKLLVGFLSQFTIR